MDAGPRRRDAEGEELVRVNYVDPFAVGDPPDRPRIDQSACPSHLAEPGDEPERDDVDALEILGALHRAVAGHEHFVPALGEPLGPADEVDRAHVADAEDAKRSRGHVVQC